MKVASSFLMALLLSFAAGCLNKEPEGSPSTSESGTSLPPIPTSSRDPPVVENSTPIPRLMLLNDCVGWVAASELSPIPLTDTPRPKGWEPSQRNPNLVLTSWEGYRCNRISIGPFERGPVNLVLDGHDDVNAPEGCSQDRNGIRPFMVLNSFWVEDADLADYLARTYSFPVHVSSITDSAEQQGALTAHDWSWGEGDQISKMTILDDGTSESALRNPARFFWQWGTDGIAAMEFVFEVNAPTLTGRGGEGELQPPMLWATSPTDGAFTGRSTWYSGLDVEASFSLYSDRYCDEPVPA